MDKLKKYLAQHEPEMRIDVPDEAVWQRIESNWAHRPARHTRVRNIMKYVAAACIVSITATGIWFLIKDQPLARPQDKNAITETPVRKDTAVVHPEDKLPPQPIAQEGPGFSKQSPPVEHNRHTAKQPAKSDVVTHNEVTAISKGYDQLFTYQLNQVRSMPVYAEKPGYFAVFTDQLKQMEKDEHMIRRDIQQYGLTNELLEQLINVYQQKLNVLKSLQAEINKMNSKVKEKQLPSRRLNSYYLNL